MDRTLTYVRLASDVRRLWERLSQVSDALVELRQGEIAAQCCDLELQLMGLHEQLLERASDPFRPPSREQPSNCPGQLEIPF